MQYLLLIYENEKRWGDMAEATRTAETNEYRTLTQALVDSKQLQGGNALQPTSAATTVRVRDGKRLTTDGPFAETKEQLGGYYLIEAKDLDAAIAAAAKIPAARVGSIEVRPIMEMSGGAE